MVLTCRHRKFPSQFWSFSKLLSFFMNVFIEYLLTSGVKGNPQNGLGDFGCLLYIYSTLHIMLKKLRKLIMRVKLTFNKSVSQTPITLFTIQLVHRIFRQISSFVQVPEYILGNFCLPLGCGPSEVIKTDVEPLVNFCMQSTVFVTNLLIC